MTTTLKLTLPQLRLINRALALYEADDHDEETNYQKGLTDRTRRIIWDALGDEA